MNGISTEIVSNPADTAVIQLFEHKVYIAPSRNGKLNAAEINLLHIWEALKTEKTLDTKKTFKKFNKRE